MYSVQLTTLVRWNAARDHLKSFGSKKPWLQHHLHEGDVGSTSLAGKAKGIFVWCVVPSTLLRSVVLLRFN